MTAVEQPSERKTLRERVEGLLPEWQAWYANLFDAACDLGVIRARVCDLSTLVLSKRHANIQNEALQAFREKWSVEEPEENPETSPEQHRSHTVSHAAEDRELSRDGEA